MLIVYSPPVHTRHDMEAQDKQINEHQTVYRSRVEQLQIQGEVAELNTHCINEY